MKFAHLADVHVGGWREEELKELGLESFSKAIDICIQENVGFVLIAGDLFNTSLPPIEIVKKAAEILNRLKEADISVYVIPGSHDFSPSGSTMLDVLEKAGLLVNVMKFEEGRLKLFRDKTGVKITGLYGRKGGLEVLDYAKLDKSHLENEKGFKIFMFHTTLDEFKPEDMHKAEGESFTSLPKGFNYYAGGHVHYLFDVKKEEYGLISFPGPVFPNNFKELEDLKFGTFCIIDDQMNLRRIEIKLRDVESFKMDVTGKSPNQAEEVIKEELEKKDLKDKIVTLRVNGVLESGKVSDINFDKITENLGAFIVLKNINKLSTKEFSEFEVKGENVEEIENSVIKEHIGQVEIEDEEIMIKDLMGILSEEKHEGEKAKDYETRLIKNLLEVIKK